MAHYTYGSDPLAVERLELVAHAYEPVSRRFLVGHAPAHPDIALDLGCGPGFSTQLVADVCAPTQLFDVDASSEFLAVARAAVPGGAVRDGRCHRRAIAGRPGRPRVRPTRPAHLPDPRATAETWQASLRPGGAVLIEDLEEIDAPAGPLRAYDDLAAAVVRAAGGLMYAGPALAELGGSCTPVTVPTTVAARIYQFNLRRWWAAPPPGVSREQLEELHAELEALAATNESATLSWIVRQLVLNA